MLVAVLIVPDSLFLNAFRGSIQVYADLSVRAPVGRQSSEFKGVERASGVSGAAFGQKSGSILIKHYVHTPKPALSIIHCPVKKCFYIFFRQRFKFKDHGSGKKGPVHFKIGIFRRRAYQHDSAFFHIRQQVVLLGFVESVYLIYKKDRFSAVHAKLLFGAFHGFFHILFSCGNRRKLDEGRAGRIRYDLGERSLSGTGRAVKNNGT